MNKAKYAALLIFGITMAFGFLPSSSFAADAPAKKPAVTKPDHSDACEKKDHRDDGMMGGGYGHGMMGGYDTMMESPRIHMVMALDLSEEQRSKINKLSDELRHKNWAAMGLIVDESARLRDLYEADKPDPKAIGNEYQKIFDLKRQMIEAMVDTQNHVEELLTPEQLNQLKDKRRKFEGMHGYPKN